MPLACIFLSHYIMYIYVTTSICSDSQKEATNQYPATFTPPAPTFLRVSQPPTFARVKCWRGVRGCGSKMRRVAVASHAVCGRPYDATGACIASMYK